MSEQHRLLITLDVIAESEILTADKKYSSLEEVNADVFEFLKKFGTPDHGAQQITISITSVRK